MAGKSKAATKRGRPSKTRFAPKAAVKPRRKKAAVSPFGSRQGADSWMKERLAKQAEYYELMIDQLHLDLKANTAELKKLAKRGDSSSELMRGRQSILTSLRTMMAGQQMLMISLMKEKKLLGNLDDEEVGGDMIIQITRLPQRPPDPVREEAPPDGTED